MKSGTKLCMALILLSLLFVGGTYAALLSYFGQIKVTTDVKQAILVDGKSYPDTIIEETATVAGGESFCRHHWLTSQTSVPVTLQFETTCPQLTDDEIIVTYLESTSYSTEVTTLEIVQGQYYSAVVTVEDVGTAIQWTFDMLTGKALEGDGHWGCSVTISLDGETPEFQIHNNDGTCSAYDWGTWLYSPYDKTGGGWHGWHTSEADWNTEVTDIWWVDATGDRYYVNNPTGIFTITIDKTKLDATFGWAVYVGVGGFYAPNNGYSSYPSGFTWGSEVFDSATILEPIPQPFTLAPGERLDFYIRYSFDLLIRAGAYVITTTIVPA